MSAFVAQQSYDAAMEVLAGHESLLLSSQDRDQFLAALDSPPEPNSALKSLLQSE